MKKNKRGINLASKQTGASNAWRHAKVGGFASVGVQSVGTLDVAIVHRASTHRSTRQLQDIRSLQAPSRCCGRWQSRGPNQIAAGCGVAQKPQILTISQASCHDEEIEFQKWSSGSDSQARSVSRGAWGDIVARSANERRPSEENTYRRRRRF